MIFQDKVTYILHIQVIYRDIKYFKGFNKNFLVLDPEILFKLSTNLIEKFLFIIPKRGIRIYKMMIFTFTHLVIKSILFKTFD